MMPLRKQAGSGWRFPLILVALLTIASIVTMLLIVTAASAGTPSTSLAKAQFASKAQLSPTSSATVCSTTQQFTGSITSNDPGHFDVLNADGVASSCSVAKTCPGLFGSPTTYHYDRYTFTNNSPYVQCITV